MKDKLNSNFSEEPSPRLCERENDLIAYLYNEASDREARDFERHMARCPECRTEFNQFKFVRESVSEWRDSVVMPFVSRHDPVLAAAPAANGRNAFAALREFFLLSPLWLRGVSAFASLAFVALVFVAGMKVGAGPAAVPGSPGGERMYSQAEVNSIVAERVRAEREAVLASIPSSEGAVTTQPSNTAPAKRQGSRGARSDSNRAYVARTLPDRLDNENIPSLYSLMSESANPNPK